MSGASTRIDRLDNSPCSHGVVADDPELATNEEWRASMLSARKDKGWTQEELGRKVGTSQNIISLIESGGVEGSQFVLPICKALRISPPMFFEEEWQKNWYRLGRLLREQDLGDAEAAQKMVEALLRRGSAHSTNSPDDKTPTRELPEKRK